MSQPTQNPYEPPRTEAAAASVNNRAASLEILRLATRSAILGGVALVLSPFLFGLLFAPVGIALSIKACQLIDETGAGQSYRSTANGAFYASCFAFLVSIGLSLLIYW